MGANRVAESMGPPIMAMPFCDRDTGVSPAIVADLGTQARESCKAGCVHPQRGVAVRKLLMIPIVALAIMAGSSTAAESSPFDAPRIEPTQPTIDDTITYAASWVHCGPLGATQIRRNGNTLEIVQPFEVACGIPYAGEDLRIELGRLPPGDYVARMLPCSGLKAGPDCVPATPLPDVLFRVAGGTAVPVATPVFGAMGKLLTAIVLLLIGLLAIRRRTSV